MDYKWEECLNWTKCAENYLYTFTYVQYKQKYTNIFLHTLWLMKEIEIKFNQMGIVFKYSWQIGFRFNIICKIQRLNEYTIKVSTKAP